MRHIETQLPSYHTMSHPMHKRAHMIGGPAITDGATTERSARIRRRSKTYVDGGTLMIATLEEAETL